MQPNYSEILTVRDRRHGRRDLGGRDVGSKRSRRAVHHHFTQIGEKLLRPVLRRLEDEEVRVFVDEVRVHTAAQELGITQHIQQEGNVCLKRCRKQNVNNTRSGQHRLFYDQNTRKHSINVPSHPEF